MKKILLSLAALALSTGAFAQNVVSGVTFQAVGYPAHETELESVNSNIEITFTNYQEGTGYTPILMIATGGGFEIGQEPSVLAPTRIEGTGNSACVVSMDKAKWGNPYMGQFLATLLVSFVDEDGEYLFDEEDEPVMFMESYSTPNVFPAEVISVYPNGDWSNETFAEAYNRGEIRFNYSNSLSLGLDELIGEISYTRFDGVRVRPVDIELGENAEADWNYMDGCFTISINYALEGVEANEIKEIIIALDELESPFGSVDAKTVELVNNNQNVQRIVKKTPTAMGLAVSNETVSVYNVAGMLVKENISLSEVNALPKGLYIVNGKKVVVK